MQLKLAFILQHGLGHSPGEDRDRRPGEARGRRPRLQLRAKIGNSGKVLDRSAVPLLGFEDVPDSAVEDVAHVGGDFDAEDGVLVVDRRDCFLAVDDL